MKNKIGKPRKMFDVQTFRARVNMLISQPGTTELERKMACTIMENVLTSSGCNNGYNIIDSEYNRVYR